MSDFTITENERPGIEKAAQWHWQEFLTLQAISDHRRKAGLPCAAAALEAEYHLRAAGSLRTLLLPKSSLMGGGKWCGRPAAEYLPPKSADSNR